MIIRIPAAFYFLAAIILLFSSQVAGQTGKSSTVPGSLMGDLWEFVSTPAVSGYETELVEKIRTKLAALHPVVDNLGDVVVTIGSGAPRRLIIAPIDEPGFVVSGITEDGYLRVQRLPQDGLPPIFNELYSAQPVKVSNSGGWIDGVFAGVSVYLQPGRANAPKSSDIDNMYVDIGASSAAEARKAGVDNLSTVVVNRRPVWIGNQGVGGATIGDRFGAAALVELLRCVEPSKMTGTLTVAFVVQQRAGARGLQRILTSVQADEMVYVGRLLPGGPVAGIENIHRAPRREPGSGVLVGLEKTDGFVPGLASDLKKLADDNKIPFEIDYSADIIPSGYLPPPAYPAKWAHIGIATAWPDTPAELFNRDDFKQLADLLRFYTHGEPTIPEKRTPFFPISTLAPAEKRPLTNIQTLQRLVPDYGVSGHEGPVRDEVADLLPPWAKPETDEAGNLILHVGTAPESSKTPRILVVAHMDEIGFVVKSISKDGRLEVEWRGRGDLSFFLGHPAVVHPHEDGYCDAVMELPNQWDEPNFQWPKESERAIRVDVGARTPEEVAKLGIKIGDSVTIPKAYRPLLGTRANGRSFDDRVGDTALISAVWDLGGPLKDRDVTFVWSTSEEMGLVGAAALAKRLAAEGRTPDYVFAVDTFVSSDSPLESKRFADAALGKGFVVRAVDNSNIVPRELVEKVVKLARAEKIPVQFGVTGGGNDGSAFVRYGSVDVALGWPLRYSHSPAEVVDTGDVEALAHIVAAIARNW
jgi:putative aminopeptidase FrvX